MNITIIGGHGQVAMHLHPILKEKGHHVRGIIRSPEQAEDLRKAGAEPVVCDIEKTGDISEAVGQADAILFAAGAGPGSGVARKWTVDRDGAIKGMEAAKKNNISRYVIISAMGVEDPKGNEVFRAYQKAKAEADEALRTSGLNYTIIRPGRLTDDPGSGRVALAPELTKDEIPRKDVAAVLAEVLESPETAGYQFDLTTGDIPAPEAVESALQVAKT